MHTLAEVLEVLRNLTVSYVEMGCGATPEYKAAIDVLAAAGKHLQTTTPERLPQHDVVAEPVHHAHGRGYQVRCRRCGLSGPALAASANACRD